MASKASRQAFTILSRSYSTQPPKATAKAAQKASLPLQVALRREQKGQTNVDQDRARYELLKAKGELLQPDGATPSYKEWLEKTTRRRRRVRGTQTRTPSDPDAEPETEVVGQKIYLPNMVFRLMRNHTPKGQPYNPYEATFRIPRSITKNDVRSYLSAVYGVECTYIRTDNYIAPLKRTLVDGHRTETKRIGGLETTYKRAVVGLVEPFIYPNAVEDMTAKERDDHEAWMEKMFQTKTYEKYRKEMKQDPRTGMLSKRAMSNRGHILEKVMQKRKERDELMKDAVQNLVSRGASPFGVGSLKVAQSESTEP
ncbi:hypothetical protein FRC04_002271 [Tulasnella sp. 424]|nr:hypothetical protein FRC04_002271 [Tulasnella sp. 424]KAG8977345.1 hypothetical protein FRC05_001743 [Tulasnella sp. 425]